MDLFDAIPASVFTILTSKNRETYAQALLITKKSFSNDISIEKDKLISQIATNLQSTLLDFDPNVEEGYSQEDIKDVISLSKAIVNKFKETGWLESEFAKGSRLQEQLSLPPYAIQLLDLLDSLCSEEIKEYDSFMYTMYSSLKSADEEYKDYRYSSLSGVYDRVQQFESTLKGLFTDLRRHYTRMSHLKNINQLLNEHFDSYQKDIIKQIYLPLKTKDSISRFKGPIIEILTKWLRDKDTLDDLIAQASISKHFDSKEKATDDVIYKINYISDRLISLQNLLNEIDKKNQEYVQTATDKMHVLLRKDKSIKAKLAKITNQLALEKLDNINTSQELLQETFGTFFGQEILMEDSLFVRTTYDRNTESSEEVTLVDFDQKVAEAALNKLDAEMNSVFSNEGINKFMHEQMDELEQINSKDIPINDANTMILVMYAFIKGFNAKSFYKTSLNTGNIQNNIYSIPDVDFIRKR